MKKKELKIALEATQEQLKSMKDNADQWFEDYKKQHDRADELQYKHERMRRMLSEVYLAISGAIDVKPSSPYITLKDNV